MPTSSLELLALNATAAPVVTAVGETENSAFGGASTVTEWLTVAVWPASLVTFSVTVYRPGAA